MPSLRILFRHLWRWKTQPTPDPSPVDAIVRLLRDANKQSGAGGSRHQD